MPLSRAETSGSVFDSDSDARATETRRGLFVSAIGKGFCVARNSFISKRYVFQQNGLG